jgi:hypothetical protein
MKTLAVILLLVGASCFPVNAAPVAYDISFTGGSIMGAPLPTGSFLYDPAAGFSNFLVNWNGVTFDFTPAGDPPGSANAPLFATSPSTDCDSSASNPQYAFLILTQTATGCFAQAHYFWQGMYFGGSYAQFMFILEVSDGLAVAHDIIAAQLLSGVPTIPLMDLGSGSWVPESATLPAILAGALAIASVKLAQRTLRSR